MDSYRSTVLERSTLTFSLEGLQPREELLFKAFVRLLDHLTFQQWRYQPASSNIRVDLLVVAEGFQPTFGQSPAQPSQPQQPVLRIGNSGINGHGFLSWPLRPDELEKELNRLGGQAITQRGAQETAALFTGATTGAPIAPGQPMQLMRLQQWPPTHLLSGTGRMRLATLLTGKAMSLDELVYRSALPHPVCEAFVNDLQRANLLLAPASVIKPMPQVAAPLPKLVQPGLLSRIRMRLGIQKSASH
jgi:hypothetical protein